MKKIKLNLFMFLSLLVVTQSCTGDLNVTPEDDDDFLSEDFFAQPDAYKRALAGVYGNLSLTGTNGAGSSLLQGIDPGTSQYSRCVWYLQELSTDEVIWSYEGSNDPGVREIQRNIWSGENPIFLGMFSRGMVQVALSNEFIRQTTPEKLSSRGVTNTAELMEIGYYRAEARALKCLAYYHLLDLFGKAPLVTENDPVNFRGPQMDRTQLFNYIETELLAVLPSLKDARTNESGRLDKAFAWAILSKMYLNSEVYTGTQRYQDCMTMCSNIIGAGYQLKLNYLDNFKADNNTSSELIFAIESDGLKTQNYGATTVMCNGQVGSIEGNGQTLYGVNGWGGALRLRKQFVQKFDGSEFDFDSRKTIISAGRPIEISNVAIQSQGYVLGKWSNRTSTGLPGQSSAFVDTDFPLFRLADFYLMYAEAQMRRDGATNGNSTANADATSLGYINALRERANDGNFANVNTGQVTLDFMIDERARELHWEGHRRQDLIRFGKFTGGTYTWAWKGNATNGVSIPANFKVFPLHPNTINANPNLTQNTGY
ncbi:MAG: RagB/SusD family nutrient uptake outer membrane protein [Flavobacterium sp.]|uniref:RagB/SusD family nutrient uptake outer membrane protein n=1 Tax=Flavobacterium sp. TaxID=239 RepID=UPI003BC028B2